MKIFNMKPVSVIQYDGVNYDEIRDIILEQCKDRYTRIKLTNPDLDIKKVRRTRAYMRCVNNNEFYVNEESKELDKFLRLSKLHPRGEHRVDFSLLLKDMDREYIIKQLNKHRLSKCIKFKYFDTYGVVTHV